MTAQILTFPGASRNATMAPGHAASGSATGMASAEDMTNRYALAATKLVEGATAAGFDPLVLAGAMVAVVEAESIKAVEDALSEDLSAPAPYVPAYSDPSNEFRGSKYDRDLDVAQIAKRLRCDIKTARKDGSLKLPKHAKVSVRIDRYSMGCSIYARITGLTPAEMYVAPGTGTDSGYPYNGGSTEMRRKAEEKIRELMDAYLRDNSDSMSDYYDVNFSGSVSTGEH